jgi:hypothetical protein
MASMKFPTMAELEATIDRVRESPADCGVLELIVRRPRPGQREVLDQGELDLTRGLMGDNWSIRGSRNTPDGMAHPDMQLTIMNSRAIALVAGQKDRWPLAGDQLFVDLDISQDNLPPGARLMIGSAIVEITSQPHTGCKQFAGHFGHDSMKFVNSQEGKKLRLRGLNAKIVRAGVVRVGDVASKL